MFFQTGTTTIAAEVGDGDISGCALSGETNLELVEETCEGDYLEIGASDLEVDGEWTTYDATGLQSATTLVQFQARQAFISAGAAGLNESFYTLMQYTDDESFDYAHTEIEGTKLDWLKWYAGDTQVGILFESGTGTPLYAVGDGDIHTCAPAQ